jgi:hypothetical protein
MMASYHLTATMVAEKLALMAPGCHVSVKDSAWPLHAGYDIKLTSQCRTKMIEGTCLRADLTLSLDEFSRRVLVPMVASMSGASE